MFIILNYKNYTYTLTCPSTGLREVPLSSCGKSFTMTAKNASALLTPVFHPSPLATFHTEKYNTGNNIIYLKWQTKKFCTKTVYSHACQTPSTTETH
jgi:hypothetical protein